MEQRPPLPPFTFETAVEKVRKAENAWNTRDPAQVALAYSADSIWRNRTEFLVGPETSGSQKLLPHSSAGRHKADV
jgi:uncharacterized protein